MLSFIGRFFVTSAVVAPILALFVIFAGAGGHGTYLPAKILYPYTMASTAVTGDIKLPFIVLALAQYPVYGIVLDWARSAGLFQRSLLTILIVHAVSVCLAFFIANPSFSS